jgi:predicted transcriptional regulator
MKNTVEELRAYVKQPKTVKAAEKPVTNILAETPTTQSVSEPLLTVEKINKLEVVHEHKLLFKSNLNSYAVLGALPQDLSSMKITFTIENNKSGVKERGKIDLYERDAVRSFSSELAALFYQNQEIVEAELMLLADLLEEFREHLMTVGTINHPSKRIHIPVAADKQKQTIEFLSQPNLLHAIDELIAKAGIAGEENNRKVLFIVASTYKMYTPLHCMVQGAAYSGKTHLINAIAQCFPPEDILTLNRATSKSFYHYTKEELFDKLIVIQDLDSFDQQARYAFKELQQGNINSATTYKDKYGNLSSTVKNIRSHFASLSSTCKAEQYAAQMNHSMIIGVDESSEQTKKIIDYQNNKIAGHIDNSDEQRARVMLQNCIRILKPFEVINPYADKIRLPFEAKEQRKLNNHYQAFVKQITLLHQYQRQKDSKGRLLATPADLQMAGDILFDAIILKVDDLDATLRHFFDQLKLYVKKQTKGSEETEFTQREVRIALNMSKAGCFRDLQELEKLEYVQRTSGYANKGFKYKILYWDDMSKLKERIKQEFSEQLKLLNPKTESPETPVEPLG